MYDTMVHTSPGNLKENNLDIKRQLDKSQVDLPHLQHLRRIRKIQYTIYIHNEPKNVIRSQKSMME